MGQRAERGVERTLTDSGATGDKIRAADPAAAPLHTDSEASGHPTPSGPVLRSVRRLVRQTLRTPPPETFGAWRQPRDEGQRRLGWTGLIWSALLCLAGIGAGLAGLP